MRELGVEWVKLLGRIWIDGYLRIKNNGQGIGETVPSGYVHVSVSSGNITVTDDTQTTTTLGGSGGTPDAADVTYTPTQNTDWDADTDPGDVNNALDQLAERVDDLEGAGGGSDADDITYAPTTLADWDGAADPGDVEQALDQLAERSKDIEVINASGTVKVARKTGDTTRTSTTTLTADPHLTIAIAAGETWAVEGILVFDGDATGDFKYCVAAPAAAAGQWYDDFNQLAAFGANISSYNTNPGSQIVTHFWAIVANGVNAGNIEIQWAQNVSDPDNTTVYTNSYMTAIKQ